MRRFVFLVVVVPLAVVAVVLSVANRQAVTFSVDPFGLTASALSLTAPLFVVLFAAIAVGVLVGGIATWLGQGRWRRLARLHRAEADSLRREVLVLREAGTPPQLPVPGRDAV